MENTVETYTKPTSDQLKKYADLVIEIGVNLQKNQELVINSDVEQADFVHIIAQSAYEHGSSKVSVIYRDEVFTHLRYQNESVEKAASIEQFKIDERNYALQSRAATITILSDDPELFTDIPVEFMAECSRQKNIAYEKYYEAVMKDAIRWNLIAVPSVNWAKKISPKLDEEQAVNRLWHLIFRTMRLENEDGSEINDPIAEWKEHQNRLHARAKKLNEYGFKSLRYKNSLGTDLEVGLPENYIFQGCGEDALDGVTFTANMPTEEIFSAPHKYRVNGKVFASLPLFYNGTRIENFGFEFKDGKIINFWAEKGYDVLSHLLDTDEGSHYLGEVALVQYDSPIRNLETLFYETLFDENASCHLAIGEAYPSCIEGGTDLTKEELDKKGLNYSLEHVDFMVGTADLNIDGVLPNGDTVPVFRNGSFCF